MSKVLIVEYERNVRKAFRDHLMKCGYDVADAGNGSQALEIASQETIDVILLGVDLPVMDGWQVLAKLKETPKTRNVPVIMLNSFPTVQTEALGLRLGAAHTIPKKCHPDTLALTLRVALREAQKAPESEVSSQAPPQDSRPEARPSPQPIRGIGTGGKLMPLERILTGGIPPGSLTLVDGDAASGKSAVCQYFTYGGISNGLSVFYFTPEHSADSFAKQLGSIGLELSSHPSQSGVQIHSLPDPSHGDNSENPLTALAEDIGALGSSSGLIVVDSISLLASIGGDQAVLRFFSSCDRMCVEGKTIIVVTRSSAIGQGVQGRAQGICTNHVNITTANFRGKLVSTLEVRKLNNMVLKTNNGFSFEIVPDIGINIVPISRVKI